MPLDLVTDEANGANFVKWWRKHDAIMSFRREMSERRGLLIEYCEVRFDAIIRYWSVFESIILFYEYDWTREQIADWLYLHRGFTEVIAQKLEKDLEEIYGAQEKVGHALQMAVMMRASLGVVPFQRALSVARSEIYFSFLWMYPHKSAEALRHTKRVVSDCDDAFFTQMLAMMGFSHQQILAIHLGDVKELQNP